MDLIDFFKGMLKAEAARIIAAASAAASAGALFVASKLGVTLTPEVVAAVAAIAAFAAEELIRRFVYSSNTTQRIADRAAATGNTDIGSPPKGDLAEPAS